MDPIKLKPKCEIDDPVKPTNLAPKMSACHKREEILLDDRLNKKIIKDDKKKIIVIILILDKNWIASFSSIKIGNNKKYITILNTKINSKKFGLDEPRKWNKIINNIKEYKIEVTIKYLFRLEYRFIFMKILFEKIDRKIELKRFNIILISIK